MEKEYEDFYHKTGELVREWAEFELILAWMLSGLLGIDELRARVVLGSIRSFSAKRRLLLQLSSTYSCPETDEKISVILRKAKNIARNRNMLAHQMGGVAERVNQLVFISDTVDESIGTNFLSERTIDLNSIKQWVSEIKSIKGDVIKLFSQRGGAKIYTSPKMHRERADDDSNKTTPPPPKAG